MRCVDGRKYTISKMSQEIKSAELSGSGARLPKGLVLLPPVRLDDLRKDTEHDPEGANAVALVRTLRQSDSRSAEI